MKLNKSQEKAAFHKPSPLLIMAGAGTGKTTTIIERMSYLIRECKLAPKRVLALTFSNKSAEHLKFELESRIGKEGALINASTFHSFTQKLNIEFYKEIGYKRPPRLIDYSEVYFLIKNKFNSLEKLQSSEFRRNPYEGISSLIGLFQQLQEELYDEKMLENQLSELDKELSFIEDDKEREHLYQLIDAVKLFPLYLSWKIKNCVFDYGDMIYNTWLLLQSNFEVCNEIKNRYDHVLVDEFQDNNYALSMIIKKISENHHNITVVGDDDQCIYAFRGANVYNIADFISTYNNTNNFSSISLMHNYRSTQPILNLANYIIKDLPNRVEKGQLKSDILGVNPKLLIGDKNQQQYAIFNEVTSFVSKGKSLTDIAILCRTNKNCEDISKYLYSKGVLSDYISEKLFEQSIVKDVLSVFEFINKGDHYSQAIIRIINKNESEEVSHIISSKISSLNNVRMIDDILDKVLENVSIKTFDWLYMLRDIKYEYSSILKKRIDDIFTTLVDLNCSDYDSYEGQYTLHCIEQFKSLIYNYIDSNNKVSFSQLIDYIDTLWRANAVYVDTFNVNTEIDALRVMTIHQSKGKEFDIVIIPFLSSGQFPKNYKVENYLNSIPTNWRTFFKSNDSSGKELHLEDELRVFYVGLTRAKENLILTTTPKRQSLFVKKLPDKLIVREEIFIDVESNNVYDDIIADFELKRMQEQSINNINCVSDISIAIKMLHEAKDGNIVDWSKSIYSDEINKKLESGIRYDSTVNLSASSIDMYNTCSMKYKFKYIDKIPSLLSNKPYLKLGILMHRILEEFHSQGFTDVEDMYMLLDKLWISDGYKFNQQEEQYKQDALLMIDNYMNYLFENPASVVAIEKELSFSMDNCLVNGRYDRVDLDSDGRIFIYDYKTSKTSQTSAQLKKNIQLGVYALGIFFDGIELQNEIVKGVYPDKLSILSLRNTDKIESSVSFSKDDIDKFVVQINETATGISNGEFKATKNFYCDSCDYKELFCPLFNK